MKNLNTEELATAIEILGKCEFRTGIKPAESSPFEGCWTLVAREMPFGCIFDNFREAGIKLQTLAGAIRHGVVRIHIPLI